MEKISNHPQSFGPHLQKRHYFVDILALTIDEKIPKYGALLRYMLGAQRSNFYDP